MARASAVLATLARQVALFIWQTRTVLTEGLVLGGAAGLQLCSGLQLMPSVSMFSLVHFLNSHGQGIVQGQVQFMKSQKTRGAAGPGIHKVKSQARLSTQSYLIRFCSLYWTWPEPKRKIMNRRQTSWGAFCICFTNFFLASPLALIICLFSFVYLSLLRGVVKAQRRADRPVLIIIHEVTGRGGEK